MKKLEKKILKKVYSFEVKRTITEIIFRIGSIILVVAAGIIVIQSLIRQLMEQQTLDMFEIFQEDREIIKQYLGDILNTFYQELPKNETLLGILIFILLVLLILIFIRNFEKITNRIKAIKKYWFN